MTGRKIRRLTRRATPRTITRIEEEEEDDDDDDDGRWQRYTCSRCTVPHPLFRGTIFNERTLSCPRGLERIYISVQRPTMSVYNLLSTRLDRYVATEVAYGTYI